MLSDHPDARSRFRACCLLGSVAKLLAPQCCASSLNLVYQVFKNIKPEPNRFWVFLVKTGTEKVEPCFCPTYMHSLPEDRATWLVVIACCTFPSIYAWFSNKLHLSVLVTQGCSKCSICMPQSKLTEIFIMNHI